MPESTASKAGASQFTGRIIQTVPPSTTILPTRIATGDVYKRQALFSGTAACSDDEASQNLIVINGGEHFLSLDGLARAGKISVLAPAPWRVTKAAGDTWFTLSATEGPAGYSEVELSLDENPGAARSAQLAFACGDAIVPFRLSQGALSAGYDSPDYYFYVTFGTMPTLDVYKRQP